jgi:N6-L-threonylcarbamoyladenine synthase
VGLSAAKGLALSAHKPFIGVNHIEGHICANYIAHNELVPPFICLVVSGGHTHLVLVKGYGEYEIMGRTRDDAAGEAYDKVARSIGLGYPGGPLIDKLAKEGDKNAIKFPRAFLDDNSYDFSFSGLKSAVLNYLNKMNMQGTEINRADVAASFQEAVVDVLCDKAVKAVIGSGTKTLCLAGGVAANSALRAELAERCRSKGIEFLYPPA